MAEPNAQRGTLLRFPARIALGMVLLAVAVCSNREQLQAVFHRRFHVGLFVIAFGLYMGGMLLAYARWYVLVRAVGLPFSLRDATRLGMIGTLFNFVIPGAIGGDFVRAAYLCREQARRTEPIASVVIDRLVGLLGLFLLACVFGTAAWGRFDRGPRRLVIAAWIAAGVTALLLALAFLPSLGRGPGRTTASKKRLARLRSELAAVGHAYRRHFLVVPLGILAGMATHSLNVLAFHVVSQALFPRVPGLTEHFLIVPLVLFSTAVPLPFGGLGVSEHVSGQLFRVASANTGAVAMMGFRVLQLGAALLGGGVYLGNKSQVRELTKTAAHLDEDLLAEGEPVTPSSGVPSDR
jgi:uncharacterized protein (TIRG00374 family)